VTAVGDVGELFETLGHLNHVVPWEQLRQAIAAIGDPLTQRERCELLLRAVNGDALPGAQWDRLIGVRLVEGLKSGAWPLSAAKAEELRRTLRRITEAPDAAIDTMGHSVTSHNERVLTLPMLSVQRRRWVVREHIVADRPEDALAYALSLLLDPAKEYGRQLRCCAYPPCTHPFQFAPPRTGPGQPPTHYCTAEHEQEHKRQLARERKAANRAGMSAEDYRDRSTRAAKRARGKK
jgi:hypothetical protein